MRCTRGSQLLAASIAFCVMGAGAVLTGCGVPTENRAVALPSGAIPVVRPSADAAASPAESSLDLWFVADDHLVSAPAAEAGAGVQQVLELLALGPPQGTDPAVRSLVADPVGGGPLVIAAQPASAAEPPAGMVTVSVTDAFSSVPANDQVLLVGQVVLSLTDAGADSVLFTDAQGAPLAVPLPDGRLLDRAATAADYSSLVT